jgi:hypothetical protein
MMMGMINHASSARAILTLKSGQGVEHAREMGLRNNRGPWSPERKAKMAASAYFLNHISVEARRILRAERKSRWLTNVIRVEGDHKVFALAGIDPLTGRRYDIRITMPLDIDLLGFLLLVMRNKSCPVTMRLDAAKNGAILTHQRPKPVVTMAEYERRRERDRERHRRQYRERRLALAATDAAEPAVASEDAGRKFAHAGAERPRPRA